MSIALPTTTIDILHALTERVHQTAEILDQIEAAYGLLRSTFATGHKLLVCGNGGSAADASHITGELMKTMSLPRPLRPNEASAFSILGPPELGDYLVAHLERALPCIDLGTQHSLLTAVGNDTAGDMGFAQQVMAYGQPGDTLWGLSTSGQSRNVILAAATAKARGLSVLAFTGHSRSALSDLADVSVRVPAAATPQVQEIHLPVYHAICQMLETTFFSAPNASIPPKSTVTH